MFKQFLRDEQGQTTVEYLLIIAVVVVIVTVLGDQMQTRLRKTIETVFTGIDNKVNKLMEAANGN